MAGAVEQVHAGLRGGGAALRDEVVHDDGGLPRAAGAVGAAAGGQRAVEIGHADGHLGREVREEGVGQARRLPAARRVQGGAGDTKPLRLTHAYGLEQA